MKNIHLIPTDKPSRLIKIKDDLFFGKNERAMLSDSSLDIVAQNIYITSDEEISGFENNIWVIKGNRIFLWQNTMALVSNNKPKKIILTTDQDLIKDGVQAIDDEFLEWFVKNPSCESVEVVKENICARCHSNDTDECWSAKECSDGRYDKIRYKITIPQEEPKIELYMPKYTIGIEDTNEQEKPKQEWKPEEGEEIWIKVFSNWSKGTYIGYDVHKKVHLARESKEGGGNLLVSSNILPYSDMPNESKETLEEAAEKNYENKTAQIPVPTSHWVDSKRLQIQNFIEGAKSDAARDYWFEQFKK